MARKSILTHIKRIREYDGFTLEIDNNPALFFLKQYFAKNNCGILDFDEELTKKNGSGHPVYYVRKSPELTTFKIFSFLKDKLEKEYGYGLRISEIIQGLIRISVDSSSELDICVFNSYVEIRETKKYLSMI